MPTAQIIAITGTSRIPGADPEMLKRYINWSDEAYIPLLMKIAGRLGADSYQIIHESPEYPERMTLIHLTDISSMEKGWQSPDYVNLRQDIDTWRKRNISGYLWSAAYELVKGFRNNLTFPFPDQDTRIDNASIMHFEAYRLSFEEADRYNKWFSDYATNIFIPLFMSLPGIKGYDFFKDSGIRINQYSREKDYPPYLSVVYFENIAAYENYEKSAELATLRKNLMQVFPPLGPNTKWYVQYQSQKNWRK